MVLIKKIVGKKYNFSLDTPPPLQAPTLKQLYNVYV